MDQRHDRGLSRRSCLVGWFLGNRPEIHPRLVGLEPDGSPDTTFDGFLGASQSGRVTHLLRASEELVYVARKIDDRTFDPYFPLKVRADGSPDPTFKVAYLREPIDRLAAQGVGIVVLNGGKISRYLADGSIDTSFQSPGVDSTIIDIASDAQGRIIALAVLEYRPTLLELGDDG